MPHFQITLSESQARAFSEALEIYARLHMGQFQVIAEQYRMGAMKTTAAATGIPDDPSSGFRVAEQLDALAKQMQQAIGLGGGESMGITGRAVAEKGKLAWDGYQVLRRALAYSRQPEGGMTVDFDRPMKTAKEPVPVVLTVSGSAAERPPVFRELDAARDGSQADARLQAVGMTQIMTYVETLEAFVARCQQAHRNE